MIRVSDKKSRLLVSTAIESAARIYNSVVFIKVLVKVKLFNVVLQCYIIFLLLLMIFYIYLQYPRTLRFYSAST